MMTGADRGAELAAAMAALKADFRRRCAGDADFLDAWLACGGGAQREELQMRLHRLSGAAGSFGEAALGDAAAALELALRGGHAPDRAALADLAAALRRAAEQGGDGA